MTMACNSEWVSFKVRRLGTGTREGMLRGDGGDEMNLEGNGVGVGGWTTTEGGRRMVCTSGAVVGRERRVES